MRRLLLPERKQNWTAFPDSKTPQKTNLSSHNQHQRVDIPAHVNCSRGPSAEKNWKRISAESSFIHPPLPDDPVDQRTEANHTLCLGLCSVNHDGHIKAKDKSSNYSWKSGLLFIQSLLGAQSTTKFCIRARHKLHSISYLFPTRRDSLLERAPDSCDRKVASSNPGRSGERISSPELT